MKIKISLLIIFFIFSVFQIQAKENLKNYNQFYQTNKNNEGVFSFYLPVVLLRGFLDANDEEIDPLIKKTYSVSVFISDNTSESMRKDLHKHLPSSLYNDLMIMKDGSSTVTFKTRMKNDTLEEILMLATDKKSLVVLNLVGEFTKDDAKKIAKSINRAKQNGQGFTFDNQNNYKASYKSYEH